MDTEQKETEEKGCCGRQRCCGCKAAVALILLLLGGAIGFFGGRCGRRCPLPAANAPAHSK